MAINLPYPDMDFVPLDILTANELDQMVANIEYLASVFPIGSDEIANNAIISTKINNGAVTSDKIDFATLTGVTETSYVGTGGTLYVRKLFPHLYFLRGSFSVASTATYNLPSSNPLDTSQVFTLYGSSTNTTKAYINAGQSTITIASSSAGGSFALASIAYLAD